MLFSSKGNVIESDAGYSITRLGRAGLEYREGSRVMTVDCEVLFKRGIELFADSIVSWRPPYDVEQITEEKRKQILSNICNAFAFIDEPVIVT